MGVLHAVMCVSALTCVGITTIIPPSESEYAARAASAFGWDNFVVQTARQDMRSQELGSQMTLINRPGEPVRFVRLGKFTTGEVQEIAGASMPASITPIVVVEGVDTTGGHHFYVIIDFDAGEYGKHMLVGAELPYDPRLANEVPPRVSEL
jgi:hypothetical protein